MVKKNDANNTKTKNVAQDNSEINDITIKNQFAANLSTLMEQKDITGKQLHEATGYSEATISGMKNGNKPPTLGFLLSVFPLMTFFPRILLLPITIPFLQHQNSRKKNAKHMTDL